ncbi:MAG: hypothetical protein JSU95_05205 [Betaproteobacteria bacterium]|nr:MAG: hypothetical protein JSU95_05205 [Betaproteobacteria bacterium]
MPGTPYAADDQPMRVINRPIGIKVLVIVNAFGALVLLAMFTQYSGGRALLYLCVGILHGVLALGLFRRYVWASIVMIIYALFQVAGMALWSLIGLMTLAAEPLTPAKAQFLLLSAVVIPFLGWAAIYLLRQLRTDSASPSP